MGNVLDGAVFRFRSLDALLGERNELEKQSIYFSSPQQLNDPVEGARQIAWNGDAITWGNLLRHYVICLHERCMYYLCAGDDRQMNWDHIDVSQNIDHFRTPEARTLCENCLAAVAKLETYRELLDLLSSANRAITESELLALLHTVHSDWIKAIHAVFYSEGLLSTPFSSTKSVGDQVQFLRGYKNLSPQVFEQAGNKSLEILGEITNRRLEQIHLLAAYNNASTMSENRFSLLFEFPALYLKNLLRLAFSPWYVTCFTKRYDNPAMWSYYANNHNGCCLVFQPQMKAGRPYLPLKGVGERGPIWQKHSQSHLLQDVVYSKEVHRMEFFRSIGQLSRSEIMAHWFTAPDGAISPLSDHFLREKEWRREYWESFVPPLLNKLEDWAHETEMRIILSDPIGFHEKEKNRVFTYDLDALDGIVFGLNVSITDKVKIVKIIDAKLQATNRKRPFTLFQACYDAPSGKIAANPMDFLECRSEP